MSRRLFVAGTAASAFVLSSNSPPAKSVRSSKKVIPPIGMGSWRTFDVGPDPEARKVRAEILRVFFACGGRMIDSSPMYGRSQAVIGEALQKIGNPSSLFAADKVWTSGERQGREQIEQTTSRWQIPKLDLLQVHNLLDWETQLETLFQLKASGRLRYVGITSYDGLQYDMLEKIMTEHPIDFVQLSYNISDRRAENRLLPLALERGISVIANRPFQEGRLIEKTRTRSMPSSAKDIESDSWAQYMLQYIASHPAVTVTIPATSRVDHMRENISVLHKPVPDQALREKMAREFLS
ncbi:MAG: aldo/keto reductase [Parasphingorhabdus sp.]